MSFFCVVRASGEEPQLRLRQIEEDDEQQRTEVHGKPAGNHHRSHNAGHDQRHTSEGGNGVMPSVRGESYNGGSGGILGDSSPSAINGQPRYRSEIRLDTGEAQQQTPEAESSCMHWNNDFNPSDSANLRRKLAESMRKGDRQQRRRDFVHSKQGKTKLSSLETSSSAQGFSSVQRSQPESIHEANSVQNIGGINQGDREKKSLLLQKALKTDQIKAGNVHRKPDKMNVGQLRHQWEEVLATNTPGPKQPSPNSPPTIAPTTPSRRSSNFNRDAKEKMARDMEKHGLKLPPKTRPKPKQNIQSSGAPAHLAQSGASDKIPKEVVHASPFPSLDKQQVLVKDHVSIPRSHLAQIKTEDSGLSSASSTISLENYPIHNQTFLSIPESASDRHASDRHASDHRASDRRISYATKRLEQMWKQDATSSDSSVPSMGTSSGMPSARKEPAVVRSETKSVNQRPSSRTHQQQVEQTFSLHKSHPGGRNGENTPSSSSSSCKQRPPGQEVVEEIVIAQESTCVDSVQKTETKSGDETDGQVMNGDCKNVDQTLDHIEADQKHVGNSPEIFFRPGALVQLEDKRDRQLSETIVRFQAHCRGYLARHNLKQIKIQKLAITCIQRNVRKFLAVRNWPWWRLVTKVLPLLDVHRTEEELKMKDMELETLRAKVAKLETERNMLKQNVDKLDSRVTEMAADLTEEHTAATHASEMLEVETSERLRLDKECKELRSNYNALQRKSEKMEMEVMEHRMVRSSIIEADMSSDEEADSVFRLKYMQLRKEMELGKKRLQQEHEEELEQVASSRKSIERKLLESLEEGEEYKRQVTSYKRKSQKLVEESHDMKLHLETQQTRNSDLEKKQRKFDAELAKIHQDLHLEKTARERIQREHEKLQGENFLISQQLEDMKSEVKIKEDKIEILRSEMDDLSSHDTMEVKEVTALKRAKRDLESKLQDQEEELDDQAGQIQQLEQTKLRLEMQLERIKQSHQKELDTKDEEVEEVRASAQNKVKQMEIQLEEDYNERQSIQREKRDLERRVQELMDKPLASDRDTEKRLRRDLKKTKALLKDAQTMLERQNSAAPSGAKLKQLKNELEDATFATSSAVKARQNLETELAELQAQLDDMMKAKSDAEEKLSYSNREKTELESKLEDQEEDFNDLLKKHRALIHQMSNEQAKIHTHLETISELSNEKHELEEKVSELQGKIDFLSESMVDKSTVSRLEAKVRDVEARLDLEQTTKNKLENQVERLRDSLDRSSSDHSSVQQKELRSQEASRKLQRELRELRDEYSEAQRKEAESSQKKHEMELEVESLQAANDQIQSDLKLAFKRIADLQSALEDGIGSDSDSLTGGSGSDDSDSDSEADYKPRYSHYSSNRSSLLSSASSMDSAKYGRRTRVYSSTSEKSGDEVRRRSRSGKYVINPGSSDEDLDAVEARSTSRPSSLYSEDTVGSTDLADTHTSVSLTSTSTLGGGGGEIGVEVSGSKKKGFVINPDYM